MLPRRSLALLGLSLLLSGCPTPPSPAERAGDAARELNMAARWGQVDVAAGFAADDARQEFLMRRAAWGGLVRIIDTELAGIQLEDATSATVYVDVSWVRLDETTLRVTRLEQKWTARSGGWRMVEEQRQGGDLGLFGEEVDRGGKPGPPARFPTTVIR